MCSPLAEVSQNSLLVSFAALTQGDAWVCVTGADTSFTLATVVEMNGIFCNILGHVGYS